MNKHILYIASLLALTVGSLSCSKQEVEESSTETTAPATSISFNLTAQHPSAATKAVKTGWESGDVIFVFFSSAAAPGYLQMSWDGAAWVTEPKNSLSLSNGDSGTMRAVYLPFGNAATISNDGGSYKFSSVWYSYYMTADLPYTVENDSVSGKFVMQIPEGYVQFFVDDASASASPAIELRERHLTPVGVTSVAADGTVQTTELAHGAPVPGYVYDKEDKADGESKGYLFSGVLSDDARGAAADYHFTIMKGNSGMSATYYQKSFTGKTFYRGESEGRAVKLPAASAWENVSNGYYPFDLGIEVDGKRIYWATKNLGAENEYNSGDFYAWGETEPYYSSLSPLTWKAGKEKGYEKASYSSTLTSKYPASAGRTLLPEDDAVSVNLGGGWRMPTMAELEALVDGCTHAWVGNYFYYGEYTGVAGFRFISKNKSPNWMFMPTTGLFFGTKLDKDTRENYVNGSLWTSTVFDSRLAYEFVFLKNYSGRAGYTWFTYNDDRFYGCPVRPVCE